MKATQLRASHPQPLTELLWRLRKRNPPFVALLGAGCSMQYGLPSFTALLQRVLAKISPETETRDLELGVLRNNLDLTWRSAGEDELRDLLRPHLKTVNGSHCPAYRHLARLAHDRYLSCIVNMNFDTLFEEACEVEQVDFLVIDSFAKIENVSEGVLPIVKPNGSIEPPADRERQGSLAPILDIAASDLFNTPAERKKAAEILSSRHVLVIGYRGSDARIVEAMQSGQEKDLANVKLFLVDPGEPDSHLLPALRARKSLDLKFAGPSARFANFMEPLRGNPLTGSDGPVATPPVPALGDNRFTDDERRALESCRELALQIRATMSVAELHSIRLEQHADDVFNAILHLSDACSTPLTQAELFLARAATFLHDLGYFWSHSSGSPFKDSGLRLLHSHGTASARLIQHHVGESPDLGPFLPRAYREDTRAKAFGLILDICRSHSAEKLAPRKPEHVVLGGFEIPVRPRLIQALFQVVEELLGGHPRLEGSLPSFHPDYTSLTDPILDIHLRQSDLIHFEIDPSTPAITLTNDPQELKQLAWSVFRINWAHQRLCAVVASLRGYPPKLYPEAVIEELSHRTDGRPSKAKEKAREKQILHETLPHDFDAWLQLDFTSEPGRALTILDLLALYTQQLPGSPAEPRIDFDREDALKSSVRELLDSIDSAAFDPAEHTPLHMYFESKTRSEKTAFHEAAVEYFERILYPAWRYIARHWRLGVNPMDFAPTILELGSSRLRPEVTVGLRMLLRDKLFPADAIGIRGAFYGHQGCVQCTGQALQALAAARRRLSDAEVRRLDPRLDTYLEGMLLFFLSGKLGDEDWFGLYEERNRPRDERTRSPSYLAMAALGILETLKMDHYLDALNGESWLSRRGIARGDLETLLSTRLELLGALRKEAERSFEESADIWSAAIARTFLAVRAVKDSVPIGDDLVKTLQEVMEAESSVQRYRAIPSMLLLADVREDAEMRRRAVREVRECIKSPIWIGGSGESCGSWGYNANTTQTLISALTSFWSYAHRNADELQDSFEGADDPA